jgi:hypothetical protein
MKPKVILRMINSYPEHWFYRYKAMGEVQLIAGDPLSTYRFLVQIAKSSDPS